MDQHGTWNTPQTRYAASTRRNNGVGSALAQLFGARNQDIYIQQHRIFSSRSANLPVYGRGRR